jgi:transposase|tara:strand:- start:228 stop:824 length:597 start_codon:yes stop_codon:yes gene_type:complete
MRFDLSDEEWAAIERLMPPATHGPARVDDRRVLNKIFYILRTGAPRRDLPERYGPRTTVSNRFIRWAQRGIWKGIFDTLMQECDDALTPVAFADMYGRKAVSAIAQCWRFSMPSRNYSIAVCNSSLLGAIPMSRDLLCVPRWGGLKRKIAACSVAHYTIRRSTIAVFPIVHPIMVLARIHGSKTSQSRDKLTSPASRQ